MSFFFSGFDALGLSDGLHDRVPCFAFHLWIYSTVDGSRGILLATFQSPVDRSGDEDWQPGKLGVVERVTKCTNDKLHACRTCELKQRFHGRVARYGTLFEGVDQFLRRQRRAQGRQEFDQSHLFFRQAHKTGRVRERGVVMQEFDATFVLLRQIERLVERVVVVFRAEGLSDAVASASSRRPCRERRPVCCDAETAATVLAVEAAQKAFSRILLCANLPFNSFSVRAHQHALKLARAFLDDIISARKACQIPGHC